jgi:hypothetical protein
MASLLEAKLILPHEAERLAKVYTVYNVLVQCIAVPESLVENTIYIRYLAVPESLVEKSDVQPTTCRR